MHKKCSTNLLSYTCQSKNQLNLPIYIKIPSNMQYTCMKSIQTFAFTQIFPTQWGHQKMSTNLKEVSRGHHKQHLEHNTAAKCYTSEARCHFVQQRWQWLVLSWLPQLVTLPCTRTRSLKQPPEMWLESPQIQNRVTENWISAYRKCSVFPYFVVNFHLFWMDKRATRYCY